MREEEKPLFVKWLYDNREINHFDPELIKISKIFVAFDETGPLMFLPVREALILDSVAPNPEMTNGVAAECFVALHHVLEDRVREAGALEMAFIGGEGGLGEFAELNGHYRKVDRPVYVLNLNDLEKKPNDK
jgi:hypothetical protein